MIGTVISVLSRETNINADFFIQYFATDTNHQWSNSLNSQIQ